MRESRILREDYHNCGHAQLPRQITDPTCNQAHFGSLHDRAYFPHRALEHLLIAVTPLAQKFCDSMVRH